MNGTGLKVRRRMITASYFNDEVEWPRITPTRGQPIIGWNQGMSGRLRTFVDNFREDFTVMVTLTYPEKYSTDGRLIKGHWRAFVERLRRRGWFVEESLVWFLEFQSRGAPHFHFLSTGWISKDVVSQAWAEITQGNQRACSRVESLNHPELAASYARKYACKQEQKQVPEGFRNVGRMWGCVGRRVNSEGQVRIPTVEADVYNVTPNGIQKELERAGLNAKFYETMTGWVCFGSEREIEKIWHYLRDVTLFAGQREKIVGGLLRKTLAASHAMQRNRVKPMMRYLSQSENA